MPTGQNENELKAQWKTDTEVPVLSAADVAKHMSKSDNWIIIHGSAYNVTEYAKDHPGGADVLHELAGQDATSAYEDVGHSEDAREIMHKYLVGIVMDAASGAAAPKKRQIHVVRRGPAATQPKQDSKTSPQALTPQLELALVASGTVALAWYFKSAHISLGLPQNSMMHGSFTQGFLFATVTCVAVAAMGLRYLSHVVNSAGVKDFASYPSHVPRSHAVYSTSRPVGTLIKTEYQKLQLVSKDSLAPDIYSFVFALPTKGAVLGLPTGQHVAMRGYWDDESGHHTITRSYTPVSNNKDLGRLELVIRCYADGQLTGKYLNHVKIGDYVEFRGPTGAMRYRRGLCKKIGMIAGGTGITPMFQIIRAICEDKTDDTQVRLIYANRSPDDILLKHALDRFEKGSNGHFKVHYLVDKPSPGWNGGVGHCTDQTIREHLAPASNDTKVFLCGPPGMVNASKKNLVELGFQAPEAVSRMSDQIFCF